MGATGILPVLLFGLISFSKGERFIPAALLQPWGAGLYIAAILGCILILLLLTTPIHYRKQWLASSLFGIIAIIRTTTLLEDVRQTSVGIYREQTQVARFVHHYYNWEGISLNEIGTMSWFTEGLKVDLTGTTSHSALRGKQRHYASPLLSDSLSWWSYAHVAILSGSQASVKPVGKWTKIATWYTFGNNINFYTLDTASGRHIKVDMQEYERKSPPKGIRVKYY